MKISVRFFATLRDRAGTDQTQVELDSPATVATLLEKLTEIYPTIEPQLGNTLVSVNQEYAFPSNSIQEGDEVALFPPVSGGAGEQPSRYPEYFAIAPNPFDLDAIAAAIIEPGTGAVCLFTGAVRGVTKTDGGRLDTDHLLYEAYVPMAEKTLKQVADEIRAKFPHVRGVAIVQRVGKLMVGDQTVVVACATGHRDQGCFEAARFGIDRLKEIVPVWKKEVGPDGSTWVEGKYHPTPADVPLPTKATFRIGCLDCGESYPYTTSVYECSCGKPFEVIDAPPFEINAIDKETFSLWRYRAMLAPSKIKEVTLGEGWTPLIDIQVDGQVVHLKLESANPTGSFKDRGASLLVSALRVGGITRVHDDSSGNAGAALAAYAAQAGIEARLFVPAYASPAKLAQIAVYGADLTAIEGPRSAAIRASYQAAERGESHYASHAHHPFAPFANKSIAYELWEQLGGQAPDAIILPIGHGTQLLGLSWGFNDLKTAGLIEHVPRLIGVQATACAPLWEQFHQSGRKVSEQATVAEGIRIIKAVRADSVMKAIRDSKGDIIAVDEDSIVNGLRSLAHHGIIAEPTSAVVWPAFIQIKNRLRPNAKICLVITGSGLKTPNLEKLVTGQMKA
jgi:threonine synthase